METINQYWPLFVVGIAVFMAILAIKVVNWLTRKPPAAIPTDHQVYEHTEVGYENGEFYSRRQSKAAMPPTNVGRPRRERVSPIGSTAPPVRSSRVSEDAKRDSADDIFNPLHPLSPLNPVNMAASTVHISDAHAAHHVSPPSDPSPPSAPDNSSSDSGSSYDSGGSSGGNDGW